MFTFENGAGVIISRAIGEYEGHFNMAFPLYEYINITKSKSYDFSLKGAKRLSKVIEDCIANNKPVKGPDGYSERTY